VAVDTPAQGQIVLRAPDNARDPAIRVLTQVRDCSSRPTVDIVVAWRRRTGRAHLDVPGLVRVLSGGAARRTDRLTFRRVRVVRGVARARARLVTTWLKPSAGRLRCALALPALVGTGRAASDATRGLHRLRAAVPVDPPGRVQRTTVADHIWTCGGGGAAFNCAVTVALGERAPASVSRSTKPNDDNEGGDTPAWALSLLATLVAGGAAAAAARRPEE